MKKIFNLHIFIIILTFLISLVFLYLEKRSGSNSFFSRYIFYLPIMTAGLEFGIMGGIFLSFLSAFSFSPIFLLEIEKNGINSLAAEYLIALALFFLLGSITGTISQKNRNTKKFYKALYNIEKTASGNSDIDNILEKINEIFLAEFSFFIACQNNKFSIISKSQNGFFEETKNIILEKENLIFQVFKNNKEFISPNIFFDTRIAVLQKEKYPPYYSLGMVSLKHRNKNLGIIGFCKKDVINKEDFEIFKSIAQNLSLNLQNKKLYSFTITDTLTKLFNRRFFDIKLSNEIRFVPNQPLSLIVIDIDFFKKINDSFGHAKGDEILVKTAKIIRENSFFNFACRVGGEEFAVILPNIKKEEALKIAEKIRMTCEKTLFYYLPNKNKVTVSIGIACFPQDGENSEDLFQKADQMLYQAKERGRNRVEN